MILLKVMFSFMKVCMLAFGGGYSAVPLVANEIVEVQKWMTYAEYADLLALDELTPGPIMINCATFVGMKVAGVPGAIAATLGCCIPPAVFCFILDLIYRKYKEVKAVAVILQAMKCMSLALVATTLIQLAVNILFPGGAVALAGVDLLSLALIVVSFILIRKDVVNPILVLLGCGAVRIAMSLLFSI
ncbi:MAG: chromate transporter [Oscillospiraceae bacterium]|nr:chromate transporter [Oscillospiraceae bacterium]